MSDWFLRFYFLKIQYLFGGSVMKKKKLFYSETDVTQKKKIWRFKTFSNAVLYDDELRQVKMQVYRSVDWIQ